MVRSFSDISLLNKFAVSNGFVLWDLEMIIHEPDDAGVGALASHRGLAHELLRLEAAAGVVLAARQLLPAAAAADSWLGRARTLYSLL
jgi:hypothetical protein